MRLKGLLIGIGLMLALAGRAGAGGTVTEDQLRAAVIGGHDAGAGWQTSSAVACDRWYNQPRCMRHLLHDARTVASVWLQTAAPADLDALTVGIGHAVATRTEVT